MTASYEHTQKGLWWLLLLAAGLTVAVGMSLIPGMPWWLIALDTGLLVLPAMMFGSLTVRDDGEALRVRFGPFRVFGTDIPYADITDAASARSSWFDGWGVNNSIRKGKIYNLWGYDCVLIERKQGKPLRVGTDEPEALVQFLRSKMK